jgi:hypothetical protein
MSTPDRIPAAELPPGAVRRVGEWMVEGPRGFLGYHGPTPGYTQWW